MGKRHYLINYPIEEMQKMYEKGYSQKEVAKKFKTTQRNVCFQFQLVNYKCRKGGNQQQSREQNPNWKGNKVCYHQFHRRVEKVRGKPKECILCHKIHFYPCAWANLTGNYADTNDYIRLCRPCHKKFDNLKEKLPKFFRWFLCKYMKLKSK